MVSNLQITKAEKLYNLPYIVYIIRRPSGGCWIIVSSSDANYGDNQLLWVEDSDDITTSTYLGIDTNMSQTCYDYIRAIGSDKLSSGFLTDYGPSIAYDTFSRGDSGTIGDTEGGGFTWSEVGTCSIASGKLDCNIGGRAVLNPGVQPRIINVYVTPPALGAYPGILFRGDATCDPAHSIVYTVWEGAGQLKVDGAVIAQSACAYDYTHTWNLKIVDFGDQIRTYVNNVLHLDVACTDHSDQNYCAIGSQSNSGNNGLLYDNFSIWPATLLHPLYLAH